jgi:hypothetical protein
MARRRCALPRNVGFRSTPVVSRSVDGKNVPDSNHCVATRYGLACGRSSLKPKCYLGPLQNDVSVKKVEHSLLCRRRPIMADNGSCDDRVATIVEGNCQGRLAIRRSTRSRIRPTATLHRGDGNRAAWTSASCLPPNRSMPARRSSSASSVARERHEPPVIGLRFRLVAEKFRGPRRPGKPAVAVGLLGHGRLERGPRLRHRVPFPSCPPRRRPRSLP